MDMRQHFFSKEAQKSLPPKVPTSKTSTNTCLTTITTDTATAAAITTTTITKVACRGKRTLAVVDVTLDITEIDGVIDKRTRTEQRTAASCSPINLPEFDNNLNSFAFVDDIFDSIALTTMLPPPAMSTPTAAPRPLQSCLSVKYEEQISSYNFTFPIRDEYSYEVIATNKAERGYLSWFEAFSAGINSVENTPADDIFKAVVGLDCEWCPPWFRKAGKAERVDTIQLYSPHAGALVFSCVDMNKLPAELEELFADPGIAKVGVNIGGDGARLARDFGCHVHSLVNVATGHNGKKSMQDLCKIICPVEFHIDKSSVENGVRLGDWAAWPLSELQVKYASMDACVSFVIFLYQKGGTWNFGKDLRARVSGCTGIESADPAKQEQIAVTKEGETEYVNAAKKNANFFQMHRNKSIPPPNLGSGKEQPRGPSDCLSDVCVVISGVLDSMTREAMATYVQDHGGRVIKAITKAVTHLINDVEGTVGPAKVEKCRNLNVPVVGEDVIFALVRSRSLL
jgi:hypothetical protein